MRAGRHMLRVLVVAMLALASPAYAATPVSDQYQSAPPPVVKAASPGAAAPSAAAATGAAGTPSTAAPAGETARNPPAQPSLSDVKPAAPRAAATSAAAPLAVKAAPADAPVAAPDSDLPIAAIAGIGLLALALGFAALARARPPATGA